MAMPPPYFDDYVPLNGVPNTQSTTYNQFYPPVSSSNAPVSTVATTNSSFPPSTPAWSRPPITMPTSACTAPTSADPFGRRKSGPFDESRSSKTKSPSPDRLSSSRTSSTSSASTKMSSRDSVSSKSSAPSVGSVSSSSSSKRKSRSNVQLQQEQDVAIPMGGDHTKRDKFLERNRIAASKCRQRKKEWINGLEEAKNGLETQNSHLQMEYNGLLSEVSRMKNQIMAHANCHDPNIDKWIENEARRFVQGPTATEYQPPVPFPAPSYPNPSGPSFAMSYEGYADEDSKLSPTQTVMSNDISKPHRHEERDRRSFVCV